METRSPITELCIPEGVRRVLLVGGTFDPPHLAHRIMAEAARLWLDARDPTRGTTAVVLVPAARSPFKPAPIADDAARIELLRAMASEMEGTLVWTDEIDRAMPGQASFWVHTLERAHAALVAGFVAAGGGGALPELAFLIGADQAAVLHRWREPRRVLELARVVIVLRPPVSSGEALRRGLSEAGFGTGRRSSTCAGVWRPRS